MGDDPMAAKRTTYKSDALRSVHLAVKGLHSVGAVDKLTMRNFDVSCIARVEEISPERIRAIREASGLSQALFASALNVTVSLVSKWERGEKKPSGAALRLLDVVERKGIDFIL
jgi:putative transcriptional regulator